MSELALAAPLMALVGLSLGLLGGGGSILAVPVLVYAGGMPARGAIALSLVIVGLTSLASAVLHARAGRFDLRTAALFGAAGVLAAPIGARLSARVAAPLLLLAFSALMIVVAGLMARRRPQAGGARRGSLPVLAAAGAAVGALTGFLGVGGGFLVVPALVLLAGLSMPEAVGTSLAVIAVNAGVAALAHHDAMPRAWGPALGLTAAALAGAAAGTRWAGRFPPETLRRGFAALVFAVGAGMGIHNVGALLGAR